MKVFSLSRLNAPFSSSGDIAHDHLVQSLIRNGIRKFTPLGSFFSEEEPNFFLPEVKLCPSSKQKGMFSVILVAPLHHLVEKFFYEMITQWLLPGKKLLLNFFIHSSFSFADNLEEEFSFCEARFFLEEDLEQELVFRHFPHLASEIKLGAVSAYQAQKILESKALFSSEKRFFIHERVAFLTKDRPHDFDYDLFGQMQHFFVSSSEDFKQVREHGHLSRIVYIFYLFRRRLKREIELSTEERYISFKVSRVRLHQSFGIEEVLGVFVGLNTLKKHEVFEEKHFLLALKEHLPGISRVEGSQFMYRNQEEKIQILYLEIKKNKGEKFKDSEIKNLRAHFTHTLESQIEKLMPAVFMPRNEEEVMKNIVRLGQELKYLKDLPQGMISFEEQTDRDLTFTVIILRLLIGGEKPLRELFQESPSDLVFTEDRVKLVGTLRQKYKKEATVFRIKMGKSLYLRNDHSVDLLKARQTIVSSLEKVIGEFRDYNGGMIAKQSENLSLFKQIIFDRFQKGEKEAEDFFHALSPFEMCAVIDPHFLEPLYGLWEEVREEEETEHFLFREISKDSHLVLMTRFLGEEVGKEISKLIKKQHLASSRMMIFSLKKGRYFYLGYLLFGLSEEEKEKLKEELKQFEEKVYSYV